MSDSLILPRSLILPNMSFVDVTLQLLQGFLVTLEIFAISWLLAVPLGVFFCSISICRFKWIRKVMSVFIWVIRGTPLMLQIIIIFYVPGLLFNLPSLDRMVSVIIAIVINYAVYFSEIYRAGYESISKGQKEAGFVLGLSKSEIFFKVYLKQIIKKIIPPMTNETISLVKDTALARVITIPEVLKSAQEIVAKEAIIWPLFYTAVFYLAIVGILSIILKLYEKKLSYIAS